jgi:hypothetical protein
MMKLFQFLQFFLIVNLCASFSGAEIPQTISYQGRLTDTLGIVVTDDDYSMVFSIFNTELGDDTIWSSGVRVVNVKAGLFTYQLGDSVTLPLSVFVADDSLWLSIKIREEVLAPRTMIRSTPYAYHAADADTADYARSGSSGWTDDGSTVRLSTISDNVGIGTSTPTEQLHVVGNIRTEGTLSAAGICMPTGASDGYVLTSDATGCGTWELAESPPHNHDHGNLLGLDDDDHDHYVLNTGDLITGTLYLQKPCDGSNLVFQTCDGTTRGYIKAEDGTSELTYKASSAIHNFKTGIPGLCAYFDDGIYVDGDICATGTIGPCSDRRFKKNIKTVANGLDIIAKLRGVKFDWRVEEFPKRKFSNDGQIGFIAQEILETVPEVVSQQNDGYYSVDYGRLAPVMVEAIKELKVDIDKRDVVIDELNKEIKALREMVENLAKQTMSDPTLASSEISN